jgi:DNA-binding MarR family transcriptional regulator
MDAPLVDPHDDVALLCQVIGNATTDRITASLATHGFDDVRASHGYVFQGVIAGDTTSTQLAQRLGVSVQAVSKTVSELEAAGYLERRRDEHDGRARTIVLTRRGRTMLRRSREARAAVRDEIRDRLGDRDAQKLGVLLREVCDLYGGLDAIADRRLRPPDELR